MFEILVELLPEAIFFALFLIFAKGIREKRLLFISLLLLEIYSEKIGG